MLLKEDIQVLRVGQSSSLFLQLALVITLDPVDLGP